MMIDTPSHISFRIYQGRTFYKQFVLTDATTGAAYSLANVTEIILTAAANEGDTPIVTGSIASGVFAITAPATGGIFTLTLTDEATALYDFDTLKYNIEFENSDGTKDQWYYGTLELVKEV